MNDCLSKQNHPLKANNTKTTAVKTEFVDVITEVELVSSPVSATFSTIVTEAFLIETPSINDQTNEKTITTLYDKVFVDTVSYWAFTKNKLRPWENALKYKHFDTMYTNHRSLVNTIWKLRQQAQQLLEEADILTGRDFILWQEIKIHVSKITQTKLCQRLCRPTHFHLKETPLPPSQSTALSSWTLTTHQHPIGYTWSGEPMRCYECNCYDFKQVTDNCLYLCSVLGRSSIVYSHFLGSSFNLSSSRVPLIVVLSERFESKVVQETN